MTSRTQDWNEGLAEDLRDPEFAAEFIAAVLEEGVFMQVILSKLCAVSPAAGDKLPM